MSDNRVTVIDFESSGIRIVTGYVFQDKVYVLQAIQGESLSRDENGYLNTKETERSLAMLLANVRETLKNDLGPFIVLLPPDGLKVLTGENQTTTSDAANRVSPIDYRNVISPINKAKKLEGKAIVYDDPFSFTAGSQSTSSFPLGVASSSLSIAADVEEIDQTSYDHYRKILTDLRLDVYLTAVSPFGALTLINTTPGLPDNYLALDIEKDGFYLSYVSKKRMLSAHYSPYGIKDIVKYASDKLSLPLEEADRQLALLGLDSGMADRFHSPSGKNLEEVSYRLKEGLDPIIEKVKTAFLSSGIAPDSDFIFYGAGTEILHAEDYLYEKTSHAPKVYHSMIIGARGSTYDNALGGIILSNKSYNPSPSEALKKTGDVLVSESRFKR